MIAIHACLATGLVAGPCFVTLPPLAPDWATQQWVYDAAGIVAGETVRDCATCDLWIACTVVEDVTLRGYHPWRLRPINADEPGRWYGWRRPRVRHLAAIREALEGTCASVPSCTYLGSLSDYSSNWRFSLAKERPSYIIGNAHGAIVCVQ